MMGQFSAGSDINSSTVKAFKQPLVPTGIKMGVGTGLLLVLVVVVVVVVVTTGGDVYLSSS